MITLCNSFLNDQLNGDRFGISEFEPAVRLARFVPVHLRGVRVGVMEMQLKLDLAGVMQNAIADPMAVNLMQVWRSLEPLLEQLSDQEQLQIAGKAIDQLAEVHQVKAKHILGDWQERYNDQGPVITDELLQAWCNKQCTSIFQRW